MLQASFISTISGIEPEVWDGLFDSANPFISHAFLKALELSGSVAAEAGWQPQHLLLEKAGRPVAALPLYVKAHSYGEFVFDWSWAEACQRNGLAYYPKLLTAVPFTPSTGPRAGFAAGEDPGPLLGALLQALRDRAASENMSSWHLLFPDQTLQELVSEGAADHALLARRDVQFHWRNRGYASFDDYLASLRSSRRKNLRRERRQVAEQGVTLERATGEGISDEAWSGFYLCYVSTYLKRSGHGGYLNREFFDLLRAWLPEQLMLVTARQDGKIVASALFLHDDHALYGRYWGALGSIHCLHFEACFYQGIEFCIERGLQVFDPGTQGEHKLLRGFEPVTTRSWHWIADRRFRAAVAEFLEHEREATDAYGERSREFLPFRRA